MSLPGPVSSVGVNRVWFVSLQTSLSVLVLMYIEHYSIDSRVSSPLPQVASVRLSLSFNTFYSLSFFIVHRKSTSSLHARLDSLFILLGSFQYFYYSEVIIWKIYLAEQMHGLPLKKDFGV